MLVQIVDADYFYNGKKPVVRIFGKTENGNAVCVLYDRFFPYFYVKPVDTEKLLSRLQGTKEIKSLEWVEKFQAIGYSDRPLKLLKITLFNPQDVGKLRDSLTEQGLVEGTYESDILFKYRFMVDHKIKGMQWINFSGARTPATTVKTTGYYADSIQPVEKIENAELRIMAVDIECISLDTTKPMDARHDPIIMIALAFSQPYKGRKSLVLAAKSVKEHGAAGFTDEKGMLEEFLKITDDYDPDIITGYNINGFDMPFILERCKKLGLHQSFGRCRDKQAYSKTVGMQEAKETSIPGRVVVDSYQILKRDPWVKFHRYNLNTIAKELLQEQKDDVKYSEMNRLWNGGREDVKRFIEYARKDAELSLRLLTEKGLLDKFYELSKISGLLLQDCLGGQTQRVEMMILHEFRDKNFAMPSKPTKENMVKRAKERETKELKGATVLEPDKGLHSKGCVIVLDFKSLYPSIMRTYNISPDTVVQEAPGISTTVSPTGTRFAANSVREGILPSLLGRLLEARSGARKQMKASQGEARRILNAKQLAFKDLSNSVYGYTGYIRARLYMIDVANSITGYGRENLVKTKKLIEDKFKYGIIYADTDSMFIRTDITDMDKAKEKGEEIGKFVTENLPGYLELQFEKVYKTFLILSKKRYAGWSFVKENDTWKDIIEMKGIETVRRDWCPLVSDVMEEILKIILKEGDIQKSIALIKNVIDKLKKGEIEMEKLTIIKGITKNIESYEGMQPHIELAKKLKARNPHDPPKVGDRLGFVIIKGNQILSKRTEDPEYVRTHKLQTDSDYYIHSQLFPPLERIFSAIGVEKGEVLGNGRQTSLGDIMKSARKKSAELENLDGWDDFICKKCSKTHRRAPISGFCDCGGEILISYRGSVGSKVIMK